LTHVRWLCWLSSSEGLLRPRTFWAAARCGSAGTLRHSRGGSFLLAARGFRSLARQRRGGCTQAFGTAGALQFQRILAAKQRCWQAYRPAEAAGVVLRFNSRLNSGFFDLFRGRLFLLGSGRVCTPAIVAWRFRLLSGSNFLVLLLRREFYPRLRQITSSGRTAVQDVL